MEQSAQPIDMMQILAENGFGTQAVDMQRQGFRPQEASDGVTVYSGEQKGVPFRFFTYTPELTAQSKAQGYKECEAVDAIEWLISKKSKPTAIVRAGHLPVELLDFEVHTIPQEFHEEHGYQINTRAYHEQLRKLKPVGGALYKAYKAWKEGKEAEGTLLSTWQGLGEGDCATFAANGIYTLEALASYPPDRTRRWSEHLLSLQQKAIYELNKKEEMAAAAEEIAKLGDIRKLLEKVQAENQELRAMLEGDASGKPKAKRVRKPKQESEVSKDGED